MADIILTVWVIVVITTILEMVLSIKAKLDSFVASPTDIYDSTGLNWVTCLVFFILLRVISPIVTIMLFFYWLTHLGRAKEKKK